MNKLRKFKILVFTLSLSSICSVAQVQETLKFSPQLCLGADVGLMISPTNSFENIPHFNGVNYINKIELITKYIDLGVSYIKLRENTNYEYLELNNTKTSIGFNLDFKFIRVIKSNIQTSIHANNYVFARISSNSFRKDIEEYINLEEYNVHIWVLEGVFVAPGTSGAVPAYNSDLSPVIVAEWPIKQVVENQHNYSRINYGIGYSYSKSFLNIKTVLSFSEFDVDYLIYNAENKYFENRILSSWAYEFNISLSVNLNIIYEKVID